MSLTCRLRFYQRRPCVISGPRESAARYAGNLFRDEIAKGLVV